MGIDPGTYHGDVALWPQNSILIRGAGVRPLITADGRSVKNRDVWLFTGNDVISYNRLTDGEAGTSSYIVDIPVGGTTYIFGNDIEQGAATLNHGMISFAGEEIQHSDNRLVVQNNSFYNHDYRGNVVRNHANLDVVPEMSLQAR